METWQRYKQNCIFDSSGACSFQCNWIGPNYLQLASSTSDHQVEKKKLKHDLSNLFSLSFCFDLKQPVSLFSILKFLLDAFWVLTLKVCSIDSCQPNKLPYLETWQRTWLIIVWKWNFPKFLCIVYYMQLVTCFWYWEMGRFESSSSSRKKVCVNHWTKYSDAIYGT